jgi:hypothetical protein
VGAGRGHAVADAFRAWIVCSDSRRG